MNRKEIRNYSRQIIDEMGETPLNLQQNPDLDVLINISQVNVQLDLIPFIPWFFRKTKVFSVTVNKRTYDIVTDLGIDNFFLMENIYFNESGKRADPIFYVTPDQLREFTTVGEMDEPRVWSYEEATVIALDPTPDATISDLFKAFYYPQMIALNDDTTDDPENEKYATPNLPVQTHLLVALETAIQYQIIGGQDTTVLEKRYSKLLAAATRGLTMRQGFMPMLRPDMSEYRR